MYTRAYAHENTCACMTPSTRWSTDAKTHNLCTNMHTHTHTHVYKRIDVQMHTHMHVYIHINMSVHIHTYTSIHKHIQKVHMKSTQARLERRRGSERGTSCQTKLRVVCWAVCQSNRQPRTTLAASYHAHNTSSESNNDQHEAIVSLLTNKHSPT